MSRVSFGQTVSQALTQTGDSASRLFELQRQMASGKVIERASDNPEIATISQRIKTKMRRDEQVIRNIDNNQRRLDESETFMKATIDQISRVKTLALQAANGTYVTGDLQHIGAEINQQLESLLRVGNARTDSSSIFAGAETNSDAFVATRNGKGEITGVAYQGDDVELQVDGGGNVPVTWPGNRVFAAGSTTRQTTATTWSGATDAAYAAYLANPLAYPNGVSPAYANSELSASYAPSGGATEGSLRINGVLVGYDIDGSPTSGEGDSLRDIAAKINSSATGVHASVTGAVQGRENVDGAAFGAAAFGSPLVPIPLVFQAGAFSLNGASVDVTATDTIFTLANKINATEAATGVTAEVYDAAGQKVDGTPQSGTPPYNIRLNGGVEIDDSASGATNIMQMLGMTIAPALASNRNLVGRVVTPYALQLTGDRPGPFTVSDAGGTLAKDLGLTSAAGVVTSGTMFDTLITMRDALNRGDAATVRNTTLAELDIAAQSVEVYRTEVGVRTNHFDTQKNRLQAVQVSQKKALSDIEDVDLAAIITELKNEQNAQSAALKSISTVLNLSLLNFLG